MLSIFLMGERRLRYGPDDISTAILYRKGWALLGYFAVEAGRKHSREHLAQLLWPALPPAAARTNLRQVLANLNRVFDAHGAPGLLLTTRDEVGLYPQPDVVIDLHQMLRASELAAGPDLLALDDEAAGFGGEFLGGLLLDDCREFEAWLHPARARLADVATRSLRHLFEAQQAAGLNRQAIATARRLAMLNPWDEACRCQLMTALATDGQYAEALASFEHFNQTMLDDLGRRPALPTIALRDSIQAALDIEAAGLSLGGVTSRPSGRRWTCGIICRVEPTSRSAVDTLLTDLNKHLSNAGARILLSARDSIYACVVAEEQPGSIHATELRAARVARATLDAFPRRVAVVLGPSGILQVHPNGSMSMLGNTSEWALQLLAYARTDQAIVCESLFESLFETFALHPLGEMTLPEINRPIRVWRLGAEGTADRSDAARQAFVDKGLEAIGELGNGQEWLTQRIDEANATIDDGTPITAWMTVMDGTDRGKRTEVSEQLLVIGRASDSNLRISRRTVSRHHCVAWRDGESYRVRDLGATNHTRVNGTVVREARLNDGDLVTIGDCTLKFERTV